MSSARPEPDIELCLSPTGAGVREPRRRRIWWWSRSRLWQLNSVLRARGLDWTFAARPWKTLSCVPEVADPSRNVAVANNAHHGPHLHLMR